MTFLPGFTEPTLALLYAPEPTWTGRLENVNGNCLVSLVTLAAAGAGAGKAGGGAGAGETTAVVIATSPALPYSCLSVHACPPGLGGALIVTANGVLHFEQGGKLQGVATTGWFARESGPVGRAVAARAEPTVKEGLEGSQLVFVANDKAVIFCRSGAVLELVLETSGRSVVAMRIQRAGSGVPASCVERIRGSVGQFGERGYVFVGSEVGESSLVGWEIGGADPGTGPGAAGGASDSSLPVKDEMDIDDDDADIFGESTATATAAAAVQISAIAALVPRARKARSLTLIPLDTLLGYGGIRTMTVGLVGLGDAGSAPAELVAATGAGPTAGLTIFHRTVAGRKRRRVELGGLATGGVWGLAVESEVRGVGRVVVTSDGFATRLACTFGEETEEVEYGEVTVAAFASLDRSTIIQLTPSAVRLLDPDLSLRQSTPLTGPTVRAQFADPYLSVVSQVGTTDLFELNPATGSLTARPAPPAWTAGAFVSVLHDFRRQVPLVRPVDVLAEAMQAVEDSDEEDELYATAPKRKLAAEGSGKLELVIDPTAERGAKAGPGGEVGWHWSAVVDGEGGIKFVSVPEGDVLFEAEGVTLFPDVIEDGGKAEWPDDLDEDDVKVDRIALLSIGQTSPRPHLAILLTNGALAVYEAFPSISAAASSTRPATLAFRFVKVLTRRLPVPPPRRRNAAPEDFPPARRELVPFAGLGGYSGAFVTGEEPYWLVAADHGPAQLYEHAEKGVYAFAKVEGAQGAEADEFVVQSKQGASVAGLPAEVAFDKAMPITRVPVDRQYGQIVCDLDSGLYVGATLNETVFASFTEEGEPVFTADGPDLTEPTNYRSTVELVVPGSWRAIDGYEFRPNEFVSTMKGVSLHSKSTLSGRKDFVAVGTTVYRGEDLAARGGIYIFEVVKVVADPDRPYEGYKLKMLFFEDTKSVVGNVCDMDGYLVMSMGQKLYVRALELDEVLLAVGFLDVGVHVTSLSALKNFLLIGDALQSVTLVAFQEDPYKLVLLGRDYRPGRTSSATFLVNDGRVAFVACDLDGVLRVFEYDPANIASHAGMRLMCRTEYHAGAEAVATLLYSRKPPGEDARQNGILFGAVDGSLYTLAPVRDAVFRRLHRLQELMARHVRHFAGLNPRAWRVVRNDAVSRAVVRGVLDGELLKRFEGMGVAEQGALAGAVGTDPDTVLGNLRGVGGW